MKYLKEMSEKEMSEALYYSLIKDISFEENNNITITIDFFPICYPQEPKAELKFENVENFEEIKEKLSKLKIATDEDIYPEIETFLCGEDSNSDSKRHCKIKIAEQEFLDIHCDNFSPVDPPVEEYDWGGLPPITHSLHDSSLYGIEIDEKDSNVSLYIELYSIYYPEEPAMEVKFIAVENLDKFKSYLLELKKDLDTGDYAFGIDNLQYDYKKDSEIGKLYFFLELGDRNIKIKCKDFTMESMENTKEANSR